MSKRSINIDRLQIRVKGASSQFAQSALSGLGHELVGQLASEHGGLRAQGNARVEHVDAGTVHVKRDLRATELRQMVAQRIAASIESKRRP